MTSHAHTIQREIRSTVSFGTVRALILLLALLALLGIIYMAQSSQAALTGQHVQELRDQLGRLDREIDQMEYDIAVQTTPAKIADRARALGLHPATISQTVFLPVKNYPAALLKAPVPPSAPAANTPGEWFIVAWWNELMVRLGLSGEVRPVEASP